MKPLRALALGLALWCSAARAPAIPGCPIQVKNINPSFLSFTGTDPWKKYLRIEYVNVSDKTVVAVRFGVNFIDALADSRQSVYSYTSDSISKPGKLRKELWGDGVYWSQNGDRMGAMVWLQKVRFAGGGTFEDTGTQACSWTTGAR